MNCVITFINASKFSELLLHIICTAVDTKMHVQ